MQSEARSVSKPLSTRRNQFRRDWASSAARIALAIALASPTGVRRPSFPSLRSSLALGCAVLTSCVPPAMASTSAFEHPSRIDGITNAAADACKALDCSRIPADRLRVRHLPHPCPPTSHASFLAFIFEARGGRGSRRVPRLRRNSHKSAVHPIPNRFLTLSDRCRIVAVFGQGKSRHAESRSTWTK